MYNNKFLAIIKKDNKPLREIGNKYVYLPFNSEYTIELRNDNLYRRALAKVYIDGTEVSFYRFVLEPKETITLERFLVDGNLNKGKKFKFVSINNAPGADPQNVNNGSVKVEFWLEGINTHTTTSTFTANPEYLSDKFTWTATNITGSVSATSGKMLLFDSIVNYSSYIPTTAGVTTEGGDSNQKFKTVSFGNLDYNSYTCIELILKGVESELTTKDSVYCTSCGKKIKPTYSFCPHCGTRVEIE